MTEVTLNDFHAALSAKGVDFKKDRPRVERDGEYKYECFDDRDGNEIAFISWRAGEATYHLSAEPSFEE